MKKVLVKMSNTNVMSIEETMWLHKEKERILNDRNMFLKNAANSLVDCKETLH